MDKIHSLVQHLSLEELAEAAIVNPGKESGMVIPSQPGRALFVTRADHTEEDAEEFNKYWNSVFGEVTSSQALDQVKKFREHEDLQGVFINLRKHHG